MSEKTKTPKQLYLKLESSFPDFDREGSYAPYHIIRIGPVGTHPAINEVAPKLPISKEEILDLRLQSLDNVAYELFKMKPTQEMKVNLSSKKVIIYSHFNRKIHEGDWRTIQEWKEKFTQGDLELGSTTLEAFKINPMDAEEGPKPVKKTTQGKTSSTPGI